MSSFKKASKVNQKVHRERHQPERRAHLGILEKKKDYRFRADDYNTKKRVIKKLRNAALNRNPDEFYFHMINSETKDGLHHEKKKLDTDETLEQKKLMENKTLSYVTMKRTMEAKKIERLHGELHLVDVASSFTNSHIRFDPQQSTVEASGTSKSPNIELINSSLPDFDLKKLRKQKLRRYEDLARRIKRKDKLTTVQQKMEIAHILKNDKSYDKPKLVKPQTKTLPPIYQWKYERKR